MSRIDTGSCLCGAVQYEITGGVGEMGHCHCSMCRKAHGAAFGTYANVNWEHFRVTKGEDMIARYESSPGTTRTFCKKCGATLQFITDGKKRFGIAAGTLDTDPGVRPNYQIWTSDKAPWWDLTGTNLSHDTAPGLEKNP